MKANDPVMSQYVENHQIVKNKTLEIRDAYYGGTYCKNRVGHPINIRIGNTKCEGFEKMNPSETICVAFGWHQGGKRVSNRGWQQGGKRVLWDTLPLS
ncbi:hypothetical protein B566_EDAN014207 [Ephemera danica]|nr:hypothetical protein B566_EDAN014207 [Ephemera danica]